MKFFGLAYCFDVMFPTVPMVTILLQRRALIMIIRHGSGRVLYLDAWLKFTRLRDLVANVDLRL